MCPLQNSPRLAGGVLLFSVSALVCALRMAKRSGLTHLAESSRLVIHLNRHCEERSNPDQRVRQLAASAFWIASLALAMTGAFI
jgi:hypothetical protein